MLSKTVGEYDRFNETLVLGNAYAGRVRNIILVCGFADFRNESGQFNGQFPFMGYFVPSSAAFIKMTFVPHDVSGLGRDKMIDRCRTLGLRME